MIRIGLNYSIKPCVTETQEKWNRVQFEEATEIHLHEACTIFTKKQVVKYLGSKFKLFELVINKSKETTKWKIHLETMENVTRTLCNSYTRRIEQFHW